MVHWKKRMEKCCQGITIPDKLMTFRLNLIITTHRVNRELPAVCLRHKICISI